MGERQLRGLYKVAVRYYYLMECGEASGGRTPEQIRTDMIDALLGIRLSELTDELEMHAAALGISLDELASNLDWQGYLVGGWYGLAEVDFSLSGLTSKPSRTKDEGDEAGADCDGD